MSSSRTVESRINEYTEFMGRFSDADMLAQLIRKDFFSSPASVNYHGEYEGGLFDHSICVARSLVDLTQKLNLSWQNPRSPYIVGMFHDLCKCDFYEEDYEGYAYSDSKAFPGHGAKSVMELSTLMQLTEEEVYCIRYHMGAYEKDEWEYYDRAIRKYPNVLWTHTADMVASKVCNV